MQINKIFILAVMLMLLSSCVSKYEQLKADIAEQEKVLFEDNSGVANRELAEKMNKSYLEFADQFPNDSLAPEYLFRAAEIDANVLGAQLAIGYYDRIIENHKNFDKYPETIFMKAFIYDRNFKNVKMAERFYKIFIKQFPDHELTDDARLSIQHLGLSDEELIKMFQQKNRTTN